MRKLLLTLSLFISVYGNACDLPTIRSAAAGAASAALSFYNVVSKTLGYTHLTNWASGVHQEARVLSRANQCNVATINFNQHLMRNYDHLEQLYLQAYAHHPDQNVASYWASLVSSLDNLGRSF